MTAQFYTAQILLIILAPFVILFTKKLFKTTKPFQVKMKLNWKFFAPIIAILLVIILLKLRIGEVNNNYSLIEAITSCFIAPITEEIVYRGFAIGTIFLLINQLTKKNHLTLKQDTAIKNTWVIIAAILFTLAHSPQSNFSFLIRFSTALIYTTAYLSNNKNLLPAITTHSIYNTMLLMMF